MRREAVPRLAKAITQVIREKDFVAEGKTDDQIQSLVEWALQNNLDQERDIEEQAKKLMEKYKDQVASGAIDPQKAYQLIKKQIAQERKFVF